MDANPGRLAPQPPRTLTAPQSELGLAAPSQAARQSVDQALCFYDVETVEELGWGARLLVIDPTSPHVLEPDEADQPRAGGHAVQ